MNIAVVMGGFSGESKISLKSGNFMLSHLDKNKYNTYGVVILKDRWFVFDDSSNEYELNKGDFSFEKNGTKTTFDVVLNTIHGTPGEDGQIQAYWNILNIPYSGCNFYESALTFNKKDTLSVLSKYEIPMAKSVYIKKGDAINFEEIEKKVGIPFIVKPNQSGSSLGVSLVTKKEEFNDAIKTAFNEDFQILIEEFLEGTEVSVGVVKYENKIKVVGITEIVTENTFFDYEAKYEGKSEEITPARIPETEKESIHYYAEKVYETLNISGFSRIDFIIKNNVPHFIEINTNPGLSPASIFPQQVAVANLNFSDLLESEIQRILTKKNSNE